MIHPSDEELLDLALPDDERDGEVDEHVRECAECALRFARVSGEQNLLRRAFAEVEPPAGLRVIGVPRARRWPWAVGAVAAMLLVAVSVASILQARAWKREAERLAAEARSLRDALKSRPLEPAEESRMKMKNVAHQMGEKRAALFSGGGTEAIGAFVERLDDFKDVLVESLECSLGPTAPLTPAQKERLGAVMDRFYRRSWESDDPQTLVAEYQASMRQILTDAQYREFERQMREEAEWARDGVIDMLVQEIAERLDLRHSEGERVRGALGDDWEMPEAIAPFMMADPADVLRDDPKLVAAVRRALDASHHAVFDDYLRELGRQRAEIEAAMKKREPK